MGKNKFIFKSQWGTRVVASKEEEDAHLKRNSERVQFIQTREVKKVPASVLIRALYVLFPKG